MSSGKLAAPVSIHKTHRVDLFDCGSPELNDYLQKFALANHQSGLARSYVACRGKRIVGFYSLVFGSISHADATARASKGIPRHPIPIILIARLAVDKTEQGAGMGKGLVRDAMLRTLQAADIGGLRAILVHAKDQTAAEFYERFGFEPSPTNKQHLMMLMKDIRATFET